MIIIVTARVVVVDSQDKNKKRNLALKIIIPVVVVAIIAGIWFFKTNENPQETVNSISTVTTIAESQEAIDSDTPITTTDEMQETTDYSSSETITVQSSETTDSSSSTTATDDSQEKINVDFVLAATEINLEKLKSYGLPIIIDFGADECIPCKEMAPVLKKLNKEWQGKVIVKFVGVWKYPNAAADFPVQMIPTQFFFNAQGKTKDSKVCRYCT